MFPFYFGSFLLVCILGFWGWCRALKHRPYRMIFVCRGICLVLFVAFCIRDAQDVERQYEMIIEQRNDPSYYDDPVHRRDSPFFENFHKGEMERLNAYQWSMESADWRDPQNLQKSVDILQNVHFIFREPDKMIESADDPYFVEIMKGPISHLGEQVEVVG